MYLVGVPTEEVAKITHENALQVFSFDAFAHVPKSVATVGALRAQATDVDLGYRSSARLKKTGTDTVSVLSLASTLSPASYRPRTAEQGRTVIDFDEQVVIVTGAGRGLGRLYALDLAARGASVVVNDLGGTMHGHGADDSIADKVVKEIEVAGGVAVASHDSVATPEGGDAIVQSALKTFGRLDAVVSNAGIFHTAPFDELEVDDWRRMLNVHVDGGFFLSQPAYRVMKRRAMAASSSSPPRPGSSGSPTRLTTPPPRPPSWD